MKIRYGSGFQIRSCRAPTGCWLRMDNVVPLRRIESQHDAGHCSSFAEERPWKLGRKRSDNKLGEMRAGISGNGLKAKDGKRAARVE